jgi:hypothetical protein
MSMVDVEYPELVEDEELPLEEGGAPLAPRRGRRTIVFVLGILLAGVVLVITLTAFVGGSWWYSYGDIPMDASARTRVEAIRDEVRAAGTAPEVVMWLDAALDPGTNPTDARSYLTTARGALKASDDPKLVEAAEELRAIIQIIQGIRSVTVTPHPIPTLRAL